MLRIAVIYFCLSLFLLLFATFFLLYSPVVFILSYLCSFNPVIFLFNILVYNCLDLGFEGFKIFFNVTIYLKSKENFLKILNFIKFR